MSFLLYVLANGGDETPIGVLVFFAIVIAAVLIVVSFSNRTERDERIRLLAVSLHGTALPGSLFDPGKIRFQIRGRTAEMSFNEHREQATTLRVPCPQFREGRLRIVPDSTARTFLQCLSPKYYPVGDRIFDALYRVEADPPSLVGRLFSPERRRGLIESIRSLGPRPGLEIKLEPGGLELRVLECLQTSAAVQAMERAASEIVGIALGSGDPGTQGCTFVEEMSGHCPICTSPLREPLIRCSRCRSPHHQECWEYLGYCATFGCDPRAGRRRAA